METNHLYFAVGAVAALAAVLALVAVREFWLLTVLPLWRRWRYRGVNISGGWKGLGNSATPAPGEWTEAGMTLEQNACDLRGLLWIRRCSAEDCVELRLPVVGTISDGFVTLGPSRDSESAPVPVTAVLKIEARDSSLNGQLLYRDACMETVAAIHMSVHRATSMALPRVRPIANIGISSPLVNP